MNNRCLENLKTFLIQQHFFYYETEVMGMMRSWCHVRKWNDLETTTESFQLIAFLKAFKAWRHLSTSPTIYEVPHNFGLFHKNNWFLSFDRDVVKHCCFYFQAAHKLFVHYMIATRFSPSFYHNWKFLKFQTLNSTLSVEVDNLNLSSPPAQKFQHVFMSLKAFPGFWINSTNVIKF